MLNIFTKVSPLIFLITIETSIQPYTKQNTLNGGAKTQVICLYFKIKHYLCHIIGNRLRKALQNIASLWWSNSGRLRL